MTSAVSTVVAPATFVHALIAAVAPSIKDGEIGRDYGRHEADTYRAVASLLGYFTVADAALLLPALYAAVGLFPGESRAYDAHFRICDLIECFIADARPSSPDCVSGRAYILSMSTDDRYRHPSEFAMEGMRRHLPNDVDDLRSASFLGERFASDDPSRLPRWLLNSLDRFQAFSRAAA